MPIIVADASGAFCHLGHRGANKRTRCGTVLRRGSSAVDKYNELPALQIWVRLQSTLNMGAALFIAGCHSPLRVSHSRRRRGSS